MSQRNRILIIIAIFMIFASALLIYSNWEGKSFAANKVSYFLDNPSEQAFHTILEQEFTPLPIGTSIPSSTNTLWIKLEIPEAVKMLKEEVVLFSGSSEMVPKMTVWLINQDQVINQGSCAAKLTDNQCKLPNLQYAYPIEELGPESQFVLIKANTGATAVPNDFHFMTKPYYNKTNAFLSVSMGATISAFFLFSLLSLVILSQMKSEDLKYFAIFCALGALTVFIYRGLWDALLPSFIPDSLNFYSFAVFLSFSIELVFIQSFFKIARRERAVDITIKMLIAIFLIMGLLGSMPSTSPAMWQLFPWTALLFPLAILSLLLYFIYKKEESAFDFLLAWSPELAGYILLALYRFDILDGHWALGYAPLYLRPLQLFLFNLLLFNRLKKMTTEIEYARAKEQQGNVVKTLLRTLSHDLSNTTGIINMNTEMALMQELPIEAKGMLERVKRAALAQADMIKHAKTTYLKRGSDATITLVKVDLCECIEAALDTLDYKASKKGVELAFVPCPEPVFVFAERISLTHQVLVNLIDNAIKFTPQAKAISIEIQKFDKKVSLSISDQGIGLPLHLKEKIFDEAPEISRPGTDREAGTGLGLLVVRDFVAAYGAKITVQSKEGKGTTFTIDFNAP